MFFCLSRFHIEVYWVGFHDPHSDIDHYEVCISSSITPLCDIRAFTNAHLFTQKHWTGIDLPTKTSLYATVRVFNEVGLYTDLTSDRFIVDDTPPLCTSTPEFTSGRSDVSADTTVQWDVSVLTVSWMFTDDDSPIIKHKISVTTHHNGHTYVDDIELFNENYTTVLLAPDHWLQSGDRYQVTVIACNAAGLCSSESSKYLLLDSSPPHVGAFKDDIPWQLNNDSKTTINLVWGGFEDPESGVKRYHIALGKTYSGTELSVGHIVVEHVGESRTDQYTNITLNDHIEVDGQIILSIMAENNAGLLTTAVGYTTDVLQMDVNAGHGILKIEKHSCHVHYCNKHCTCASLGRKCSSVPSNSCVETVDNSYQSVHVYVGDILGTNVKYSMSAACLSGNWQLSPPQSSLNAIRMEWSMGIADMEYGVGVFDPVHEDVWNDIGLQDHIVHCVGEDRAFLHNHNYVVYIRAWYNATTYRIFSSESVLIDITPPKIFRGFHIKDSVDNCQTDVEYSSNQNSVTGCWRNGFSDPQCGLMYVLVSMGTSPGGT